MLSVKLSRIPDCMAKGRGQHFIGKDVKRRLVPGWGRMSRRGNVAKQARGMHAAVS